MENLGLGRKKVDREENGVVLHLFMGSPTEGYKLFSCFNCPCSKFYIP